MTITMIIISAIVLLIAYIAGHIMGNRFSAWQCPDCGSKNTYEVSSVWGGVKGGRYNYAIKNWEYHRCEKCDCRFTINMKLIEHGGFQPNKQVTEIELKELLAKAVEEDRFEEAAQIRDKLKTFR